MSTWMPWKIARKELKVISRKKSIMFYTVALPFLLAFAWSLEIRNVVASGIPSTQSLQLSAESLLYFFIVLVAVLPSTIASYSIVGEKIEKTLEPLLATPTTDGEILLGKSLAAFLPPMLSMWAGASAFMATSDYIMLHAGLGYYYFPNWNAGVMLLILAPLAAVFSVETGVLASSRVTDVRGANQISGLMFIPFMAFFVAGVEGIITFSIANLLIFAGGVLIFDVALYFVSKRTFRREEILTKWK